MSVLLAVDLRHQPEVTVNRAKSWLVTYGKPVDLVFVDEFRSTQPFIQDAHIQALLTAEWEKMAAEDERAMGSLLDLLPTELRGKALLRTGPAASSIIDLAPSYEMVIVATHGRTGLSHFWLGSVAEKVVRSSESPVLVLRLETAED